MSCYSYIPQTPEISLNFLLLLFIYFVPKRFLFASIAGDMYTSFSGFDALLTI